MTYYENDKERIKQAEELQARLNGIKVVYKTVKPKRTKPNKWNKESEDILSRISQKYKKHITK